LDKTPQRTTKDEKGTILVEVEKPLDEDTDFNYMINQMRPINSVDSPDKLEGKNLELRKNADKNKNDLVSFSNSRVDYNEP
jgi:hypothetical protein